jgi:hypothetical protein
MDDALVGRWRSGDATATTAIRNALRSTAERIFGHPALWSALVPQVRPRFQGEDARRELTAEIAREVMKRKVETANELQATAMMLAARKAAEALLEGNPQDGGAHLPAPMVVTYALAPAGLAPRVKEALDKHLAGCQHCTSDVRVLERIVSTPEEVEAAMTAQAAELAPAPSDMGDDIAALMRQVAEDDRDEAEEKRGASRGGARPPPRAEARPAAAAKGRGVIKNAEAPRRPAWLIMAPFFLIVAGLGWYLTADPEAEQVNADRTALAGLADRSPPEITRLGDLPPEAQLALQDLARKDCRTAAGRFQTARRTLKDKVELYLLEAGSFVCAGDGRRALRTLDELQTARGADAPVPEGSHWIRGQAFLLEGDGTQALSALSQTEVYDARHRLQASEQIKKVRAAGSK